MKLFEYKCPECGNVFEEMVKSYDEEVKCPECGKPAEKNYSGKIYTSTGKGSGACTGNCATCGQRCH